MDSGTYFTINQIFLERKIKIKFLNFPKIFGIIYIENKERKKYKPVVYWCISQLYTGV